MYEISSVADHANVILMDDDILCEPETILRLNAFANLTPSPTIVGAQMLYLKNTRELHVSAEQTQLHEAAGGPMGAQRALHNVGHDQVPAAQARRRRVQRVVVMSDPVGSHRRRRTARCRCSSSGTTSNTACARWTRDSRRRRCPTPASGTPTSTGRTATSSSATYSVRNSLITHALHGTIDTKATGNWLAREITEGLVSMQYGMAYTMIRGIEDFLAGPEVLRDGGAAALAAIRSERKRIRRNRRASGGRDRRTHRLDPANPSARPPATQGANQPRAGQTLAVPMARAHHPRAGRHRGRRQPVVARLVVRPGSGDRCLAIGRSDTTTRQAEAQQADQANDEGAEEVPGGGACAAGAIPPTHFQN